MQNVVAVIVLVSIGWAYYRRLVLKPPRLTLNRDALLILGMIGGVVATELFAQFFQVAAHGDIPGGFISNAVAIPLRSLPASFLEAVFAVLWWGPYRAGRRVPVLPAVQQAPAHRDGLPEHLFPQARAARGAAQA